MINEFPIELKCIEAFIKRAEEMIKADIIVSYYCYYWAVKLGLNLPLKTKISKEYLEMIIETLERIKKESINIIEIHDEAIGEIYMKKFAEEIFKNADNDLKMKCILPQTSKKFLAAVNFFEVTKIWGELNSDVLYKIKYAKMCAIDIIKAYRDGLDPNNVLLDIKDTSQEKVACINVPEKKNTCIENDLLQKNILTLNSDAKNTNSTLNDSSLSKSVLNLNTCTENIEKEKLDLIQMSSNDSNIQIIEDRIEKIEKAQKHARWAISALNFEDLKTAISELKLALSLLESIFIPCGVAAEFPKKYVLNEHEYKKIQKLIDLQVKDTKKDSKKNKNENINISEDEEMIKKYNLDNYDMESDSDQHMGIFTNIENLMYYENEDDPYITLKEDNSQDERNELQILSTDHIILVAKTEDDISYLEEYIYEISEENLYVHHDIMLPAPPLSLEWFNYQVGAESDRSGNFVAIGTLDPDIEIWDLDVIDPLYPSAILGNLKKKRKKSKSVNSKYHVDSILSLSINKLHKNILASGSADTSIKLWDLKSCICTDSYVFHTNKVSYIEWHPSQPTLLLSGSFDHTTMIHDVRSSRSAELKWDLKNDIESVKWDLHNPFHFYVCTDSGMVYLLDTRNPLSNSKHINSIWTLQAHDGPISAFDINSFVKGYFITGSTDKSIKLWNAYGDNGGPNMILSKDIGVGKVFSARFSLDRKTMFSMVAGGSNGIVKVWDTLKSKAVRNIYEDSVIDLPCMNEVENKNMMLKNEMFDEN
ncbi:hypothetical protein PCANB_000142 [Pneumocystis canis]|nr:hypothetical protein PCANB_000142 [Pneumocystis canis]